MKQIIWEFELDIFWEPVSIYSAVVLVTSTPVTWLRVMCVHAVLMSLWRENNSIIGDHAWPLSVTLWATELYSPHSLTMTARYNYAYDDTNDSPASPDSDFHLKGYSSPS